MSKEPLQNVTKHYKPLQEHVSRLILDTYIFSAM